MKTDRGEKSYLIVVKIWKSESNIKGILKKAGISEKTARGEKMKTDRGEKMKTDRGEKMRTDRGEKNEN